MYRREDLESVYSLLSDSDVTRYFPDYYTIDKDSVLSSMPRRLERWRKYHVGQLGVFEKKQNELIGYCGLQPLDQTTEIEIYYGFYKRFWGRGLATEAAAAVLRYAFEQVKLPRVAGITHPNNAESQKVLQKLGMTQGANDCYYGLEACCFAIERENYCCDETAFYQLNLVEID